MLYQPYALRLRYGARLGGSLAGYLEAVEACAITSDYLGLFTSSSGMQGEHDRDYLRVGILKFLVLICSPRACEC